MLRKNFTAPLPEMDYWKDPAASHELSGPDGAAAPSDIDFRLLAENLPVLCWIARGDGYIFWYNRRWHDYCGTTPDAMEGWGWQSVHNPVLLPKVLENWTGSIASGEPFEMTFPLRGADGVFRRFLTRIVPLRDPSGKIVRWFGTNTEVENQMRAEEALALSEAKFGVLTDAMPQMVWSTQPDGHHDYYNAQWYEFTGVPYGSTDGEAWNGMFHEDDRELAWQRWRHSLATGEPYEIEYRLRHHSGEYRWTIGRALPVRDAKGKIIRWIGTCTDIHQSKRDAQQTELLSRELSHRIKNIFAVIGGLIGLSTFRDPSNRQFAQDLAARIAALGRAHNFARPHSDASRPETNETHLHGLLAELLKPYRTDGASRVAVSGDDPPIDDRSATPIALVIHELATNAAKYGALSTMDGHIEIDIRQAEDDVSLRWIERGGPYIEGHPKRTGFGSQLSEVSIEDQLGGKIEREWLPEGLRVTLKIAASRLSSG